MEIESNHNGDSLEPPSIDSLYEQLRQAVQDGHYAETKQLLAKLSPHNIINRIDENGVTLLHWAAINGRDKIVKLLIDSGADVNFKGGDLDSTPLMWGIRERNISTVVLLLQNGAHVNTVDSCGLFPIHLAARLASLPIVAYLIVGRGVGPEIKDKRGLTPLMWATLSNNGLNLVRFLLPLSPNVHHEKEYLNLNTALHLALDLKNWPIVILLLKHGVNLDVQNKNGISCRQTLTQILGQTTPLLGPFLQASFKRELERGLNTPENELTNTVYETPQNSKFNQFLRDFMDWRIIVFFLNCFLVVGISKIPLSFYYKLALLILTTITAICFELRFIEVFAMEHPLQISFILKIWLYFIWAFEIAPQISIYYTIIFIFFTIFLWYNFLRAWLRDPGIINPIKCEKFKTIVELVEKDSLTQEHFCSTCLIRRPIRSKHCSYCNKCIARFDHHCLWIGNCVGFNNHLNFVSYVFFLLVSGIVYICGAISFYINIIGAQKLGQSLYFSKIFEAIFIPSIALIFVILNCMWLFMLLISQLYQIMWLDMTTNEKLNYLRYAYLRDSILRRGGEVQNNMRFHMEFYTKTPCCKFRKPSVFSRGPFLNLFYFIMPNWSKKDWFRSYGTIYAPDLKSDEERENGNV